MIGDTAMASVAAFVLLLFVSWQLQLASAATPIRAQWIKSPAEVPTSSSNPLLRWWTAGWTSKPAAESDPECIWLNYPRHDALKAWELQVQPRRHMVSAAAANWLNVPLHRYSRTHVLHVLLPAMRSMT